MTKELQDHVWSILPKEFRKEVKKMYESTQLTGLQPFEDVERADRYAEAMCAIFGIHNLTSDAEGEELLTCEKYKVEEALNYCDELDSISGSHNMRNWGEQMIAYLFCSKCLPDETCNVASKVASSEPAEPKEDKHFDNILKDGFRNERRLNIAAKIVASMVGSDDWTTWRGGSNKEIWHNMAKSSLEIADALISECNKGGKE